MKKKSLVILTFVLTSTIPWPTRAMLTKRSALQLLKSNSPRWQQTELITAEASGLKTQAAAALKVHGELVSREYFSRLNAIQFGFSETGPLEIASLGETILQGKYSIIDRPAKLRYEAAEENEHMSRETQKALRDDLIYFMLLNYLNAQRLSKKRAVIEGIINRDKDLVRVARARIQSGTGVRLDYLRAESLLKKDELRAKELDSNYKKAIRDLSVLLGHEVDLAEVEDLENSSTSVSKVTGERADLNSAKKMVLVTEKLKSQAASESSVRLNVFSGVGLVGSTVLGGRNAAVTGTVGIQLSIPLLDGGYQEGKLQEAAAKNRSAVLQVAQLERESKTQQEQAAAQLLDSQSSLEVAKKYLELTKEEINLAEKRFKVGSGSGLEMSNAHANYSTAEEQHTEALFGFELAKLNHFKANGAVEKYVINEGAARP